MAEKKKPSGVRRAGEMLGSAARAVGSAHAVPFRAAGAGAAASQRVAADFWEGVLGAPTGTIPRAGGAGSVRQPARAVAQTASPPGFVQDVMSRSLRATDRAGQAAKVLSQPLAPAEQIDAYVRSLFGGPLSLREAKAGVSLLPAPPKQFGAKDAVVAEAASLLEQQYQLKNKALEDQAKSGLITADELNLGKKANTDELVGGYFKVLAPAQALSAEEILAQLNAGGGG